MIERVAAIILAALAGIALAVASAAAEPALWAIKDGRSTIYLFGTIHTLKDDLDWQSPKIAAAFESSRDLWLELTDDDPATVQPLVARLGLDSTHPLSSKLLADDLMRLDQAAATIGLPDGEKSLEAMRPWMAALSLTLLQAQQAGFDLGKGVDHLLKAQAVAAGKKVHAFESAEQQMRIFADLGQAEELAMLRSTLDDLAEGPGKLDRMLNAWSTGDEQEMAKEFLEFTQPQCRELYKLLITDRNKAWTAKLVRLLKTGSGTTFVAVGAGHLVGPDSLIAELTQRGVKIERQ